MTEGVEEQRPRKLQYSRGSRCGGLGFRSDGGTKNITRASIQVRTGAAAALGVLKQRKRRGGVEEQSLHERRSSHRHHAVGFW